MHFEFATAARVIFGPGTSDRLPALAADLGRRALVVAGSSPGRSAPIVEGLRALGVDTVTTSVSGEPTVDAIQAGMQIARDAACDVVIGIGGGSVLDTGKAIAVMLTNEGELLDYMEVIGRGKSIAKPSLPYIAVPTTAGTGSEVTRNAVVASPTHKVKVSMRSPFLLPRLAVVDPQLTHSLSPEVTAQTGMDALTQLIEPYVCNNPNAVVDAICLEGMRRVARSLPRAYANGRDAAAREGVAFGSLLGGMALANARLGAVHGLASPVGGMFHAPHGAICACLLPLVTEANVKALESREPRSPVLDRYRLVAQILTGDSEATISEGIDWLYALRAELHIPSLAICGVTLADRFTIADQALRSNSMKGNAISLTDEELEDILSQALAA